MNLYYLINFFKILLLLLFTFYFLFYLELFIELQIKKINEKKIIYQDLIKNNNELIKNAEAISSNIIGIEFSQTTKWDRNASDISYFLQDISHNIWKNKDSDFNTSQKHLIKLQSQNTIINNATGSFSIEKGDLKNININPEKTQINIDLNLKKNDSESIQSPIEIIRGQ